MWGSRKTSCNGLANKKRIWSEIGNLCWVVRLYLTILFELANPGLFFFYLLVFSNKRYNKSMWKMLCPWSIWHRDSNPRPLEHGLVPITTRPWFLSYGCRVPMFPRKRKYKNLFQTVPFKSRSYFLFHKSSVTRWLEYFTIFGNLQQRKNCPIA